MKAASAVVILFSCGWLWGMIVDEAIAYRNQPVHAEAPDIPVGPLMLGVDQDGKTAPIPVLSPGPAGSIRVQPGTITTGTIEAADAVTMSMGDPAMNVHGAVIVVLSDGRGGTVSVDVFIQRLAEACSNQMLGR